MSQVIEHHILCAKGKVIVNVLWIAGQVETEYTFMLVAQEGVLVKWWRWKMTDARRDGEGKGSSDTQSTATPCVPKNPHL